MAGKSVAEKARVRQGTTIAVLNRVPGIVESLGLPDMNRDAVWAIAEQLGMRPLGIVAVDGTWSVFRLRPAV